MDNKRTYPLWIVRHCYHKRSLTLSTISRRLTYMRQIKVFHLPLIEAHRGAYILVYLLILVVWIHWCHRQADKNTCFFPSYLHCSNPRVGIQVSLKNHFHFFNVKRLEALWENKSVIDRSGWNEYLYTDNQRCLNFLYNMHITMIAKTFHSIERLWCAADELNAR